MEKCSATSNGKSPIKLQSFVKIGSKNKNIITRKSNTLDYPYFEDLEELLSTINTKFSSHES
ncbi:MAG: hypothetical protein MHPSP_004062, partial [Paramarteilia canceri]